MEPEAHDLKMRLRDLQVNFKRCQRIDETGIQAWREHFAEKAALCFIRSCQLQAQAQSSDELSRILRTHASDKEREPIRRYTLGVYMDLADKLKRPPSWEEIYDDLNAAALAKLRERRPYSHPTRK